MREHLNLLLRYLEMRIKLQANQLARKKRQWYQTRQLMRMRAQYSSTKATDPPDDSATDQSSDSTSDPPADPPADSPADPPADLPVNSPPDPPADLPADSPPDPPPDPPTDLPAEPPPDADAGDDDSGENVEPIDSNEGEDSPA